jgi:hypothetical protein
MYCAAAGMTRIKEAVPDKMLRLTKHPGQVQPSDLDIWWLSLNFYEVAAQYIQGLTELSDAQRVAALDKVNQQFSRRLDSSLPQVCLCVCVRARAGGTDRACDAHYFAAHPPHVRKLLDDAPVCVCARARERERLRARGALV